MSLGVSQPCLPAYRGLLYQQKKKGIQRKERIAAPAAMPASSPSATCSPMPSYGSLWISMWWVPERDGGWDRMLNIWCTTVYRSIGEYMSVFYKNFRIWYNQDSFLNNWFQGVLERIARFTLFTCWHQSYSLGTKRKKTDWNREGLPELVINNV